MDLGGENKEEAEREKASRTIFIANIAYAASEEELIALCSRAGHVRNFKIQTDRETGNSKGFAFAEYDDAETAQHAVLNLNNAEIHGRPIKVHSRTLPSSAPRQKSPSLPIPTTTTSPIVRTTAAIKYKPPTTTKAKTRTKIGSALHARPFDLAATINLLSIEELYEFVVETHALISTDPHAANLLFEDCPRLAHCLYLSHKRLQIA